MTTSIWRQSHFLLALVSGFFILLASITGAILAIEPIYNEAHGMPSFDLAKFKLSSTIDSLSDNYSEVFSIEIEATNLIKVSVLTDELETLNLYVDPETGKEIGRERERPDIFEFATNLHRSLFLKSFGRALIGIMSFLLLLIAATGMLLLIKRQGGVKYIFSKVQQTYSAMKYHVALSRYFFIPIVIIALSGVILSLDKFSLLPDEEFRQEPKKTNESKDKIVDQISLFNITLDQVRKVEFPFSDDKEEPYVVTLKDKVIKIDQASGFEVSIIEFSQTKGLLDWSFTSHTGHGSIWWSLVLFLSCIAMIFFLFSGLAMSRRRLRIPIAKIKPLNTFESEYIIMVGSEMGATYDTAYKLYNSFEASGKKAAICELNAFAKLYAENNGFPHAQHVLILTSTYGLGEAPSNASNFITTLSDTTWTSEVTYSIVGFGSESYPDFCKYAIDLDKHLEASSNWLKLLPLHTVNNNSLEEYNLWLKAWSEAAGVKLENIESEIAKKEIPTQKFVVTYKSPINIDQTFILKLRPVVDSVFQSGDLIAITPAGESRARYYSIAEIDSEILLAIKKQEGGVCSNFLSNLVVNEQISAFFKPNPHFYLPKEKKRVVMIANGTGIAPFIGMIYNARDTQVSLYWGGRSFDSFDEYAQILQPLMSERKNCELKMAFSKSYDNQKYVQDVVLENKTIIVETIKSNGVIMICGSLAMQRGLIQVLDAILMECFGKSSEYYVSNGSVRIDCY